MSEKLNTQDLIDLLVNRQGLEKKEAENFIKEFFLLIEEGLEKDKVVKIKGLGTFKLVDVEPRESVNVNTGERIEIQGHTKISFTPDAALRDMINKPFAHFETVILNDGVDLDDTPQDVPEEETEPVEVSEEPQLVAEPVTPKKETKKGNPDNSKILVLVVIITILLCGILLFFTYYPDPFPGQTGQKKQPPVAVAPPAKTEAVADTTSVDSIEDAKPAVVTNNTAKRNRVPFSQIPVNADSTSYDIVGTKTLHIIKEGQTLIRISYRYYGTKDLFPYLIRYNRSIVRDPNNVPAGITIRIPELRPR